MSPDGSCPSADIIIMMSSHPTKSVYAEAPSF